MRAQEKGLELVYEIDEAIPDNLIGDPGRLRQIVLNLVSNAVKFTLRGEVTVSAELHSRTARSVVVHFAVQDTGIGIPPEKQQLVFGAFSQADNSTTRRFGGTGLGLSISKQLVTLMNGKIWLESVSGEGSTFHFTAEFQYRAGSETADDADGNEALRSNLRVLIVDDHPTNRRILSKTLSSREIYCECAGSGSEALELLGRGTFDLALLDVHMPDMSGFALAAEIRKRWPDSDMKMVVLTSMRHRGDAELCLNLKIGGYLSKPVKNSDLFKTIRKLTSVDGPTAPVVAKQNPVATDSRSMRVLLAEDNLVNQKVAMRMLQRLGHQVTLANNGREAVEALETQQFDLVLMDVQMPEMDGLEATRTIRAREASGPRVRIVALTAHAMDSHQDECLAAGMDSYLTKPILFDALKAELEHVGSVLV
jgi:CheY-like chemotaxis protein